MKIKKIYVVDSQKLTAMQACMRMYHYSYGESLEPQETPIVFEKGSLMHHGLEFYYKARKIRHIWSQNNLTHGDIVQQGMDFMRAKSLETNVEEEDVELLLKTFFDYTTHFANDGWDDIKTIENSGTKILYEDDDIIIVYEFKIDLIISLTQLPILPVDHKTYSRKSYTSDMSKEI